MTACIMFYSLKVPIVASIVLQIKSFCCYFCTKYSNSHNVLQCCLTIFLSVGLQSFGSCVIWFFLQGCGGDGDLLQLVLQAAAPVGSQHQTAYLRTERLATSVGGLGCFFFLVSTLPFMSLWNLTLVSALLWSSLWALEDWMSCSLWSRRTASTLVK